MADRFRSKRGFVMASVGAAVGLGNALRFPGLCAMYGGGAFLIVYLAALALLGVPLLNAEIALGRKVRGGAPRCMGSLVRGGEKLGWAQSANSAFTAVLYGGIAGWLLCEAVTVLPFCISGGSDAGYFFSDVLKTDGNGVISGISPLVAVCVAAVWAAVFVRLKRGAEGLSRAAFTAVLAPVALLALFAVRGLFYPSSKTALAALFIPELQAFLSPALWINALGQVFFSLSLAVGIMPAFGAYLPERSSIFPLSLAVAAADAAVSVLAAVAMFTTLYGCGLEDAVSASGIITAFRIYPAAVAHLFRNKILCGLVGCMFYFSLALLAVQSATSMAEAALSPLIEKFALKRRHAAAAACVIGFAVGLPFATTAADVIVAVADRFINFYDVLALCILECILFGHTRGGRELAGEINRYSSRLKLPPRLYFISVKYLCPLVLLAFAIPLVPGFFASDYPEWALFAFGRGLCIMVALSGFIVDFAARERPVRRRAE